MKSDATVGMPDRAMPANIDAERFVLGSIMLDGSRLAEAADYLRRDDFSLEKHQRIFQRMLEIDERGEKVDRVTVADELGRHSELESVDGLGYIVSLDDGLPLIANIDAYLRIIREKAILRRLAYAGHHLLHRAMIGEEAPASIIAGISDQMEKIGANVDLPGSAIEDLPAVLVEGDCSPRYIVEPELPEASIVALTGNSGSGKSTLATAWVRDINMTGRAALILDRENPRHVIADRNRRLGLLDSSLLRWYGGWLGDVPGPDSAAVIRWVKTTEPKPLIVIDSLIAFLDGDENDAREMRRFMNGLRRLSDLGATVTIIHHDGKGETSRDFRGSSDFKAAVDQAFHVTNAGSDMRLDKLRLRCFKSRYGLSGDIIYNYADGRMLRNEGQHAPAKTVAEMLRDLLKANPGITTAQFETRAAALGIGRNRARDFLDAGVTERSIERKTASKNAKIYTLTDYSGEWG